MRINSVNLIAPKNISQNIKNQKNNISFGIGGYYRNETPFGEPMEHEDLRYRLLSIDNPFTPLYPTDIRPNLEGTNSKKCSDIEKYLFIIHQSLAALKAEKSDNEKSKNGTTITKTDNNTYSVRINKFPDYEGIIELLGEDSMKFSINNDGETILETTYEDGYIIGGEEPEKGDITYQFIDKTKRMLYGYGKSAGANLIHPYENYCIQMGFLF